MIILMTKSMRQLMVSNIRKRIATMMIMVKIIYMNTVIIIHMVYMDFIFAHK
jgi:hypothetical protein